MAETPIDLVRQFIADWHTMDIECSNHFTDGAVSHNIPGEPHVGPISRVTTRMQRGLR